jgi:hypothetical protein
MQFLKSLWIWIGLKYLFPTFESWFHFARKRFFVSFDDVMDIAFQTYEPSAEQWLQFMATHYGEDIDKFRAAAYDYRIKAEAGMAEELGLGLAYRWGSETAAAEQEALSQAKRPKTLPSGIIVLGKTPQERREEEMAAREDLLISNLVKKKAKEEGVEPTL